MQDISRYEQIAGQLRLSPARWFITGVAGFIGSSLLEELLRLGQKVVGLDNLSTGFRANLEDVRKTAGETAWRNFEFVEADILHQSLCEKICSESDYVLHQAALGSVPRSIKDPWSTNQSNSDGFLSVLTAAKQSGVKAVVYASSSSVYGDEPSLPKTEDRIGQPLSPYAATKRFNEIYARLFASLYGMKLAGLRYFNVFGPRQNPAGEYAAVIPRWIEARLQGKKCTIYGDGETSRDFCYVTNVVQANILAATAADDAFNRFYNIALGGQLSLNQLYARIDSLSSQTPAEPEYAPFRSGDVRHSLADISLARRYLGYTPAVSVEQGLSRVVEWYRASHQ